MFKGCFKIFKDFWRGSYPFLKGLFKENLEIQLFFLRGSYPFLKGMFKAF